MTLRVSTVATIGCESPPLLLLVVVLERRLLIRFDNFFSKIYKLWKMAKSPTLNKPTSIAPEPRSTSTFSSAREIGSCKESLRYCSNTYRWYCTFFGLVDHVIMKWYGDRNSSRYRGTANILFKICAVTSGAEPSNTNRSIVVRCCNSSSNAPIVDCSQLIILPIRSAPGPLESSSSLFCFRSAMEGHVQIGTILSILGFFSRTSTERHSS
mmetsp:Transcript_37940/g.92347  ORF Transcript_37940/g.92347 Transcript_37940/m.92347 type:complete len:211 (+) Transcript_37940:757-1389(+)